MSPRFPLAILALALALSPAVSATEITPRVTVDLSGPGWKLWPDKAAKWEDDELFLPPVNLAKVPVYIWFGLFSKESLIFDALMAPLVIVGGLAGLWLIHHVPQRIFEWLVVALTAVSLYFLF